VPLVAAHLEDISAHSVCSAHFPLKKYNQDRTEWNEQGLEAHVCVTVNQVGKYICVSYVLQPMYMIIWLTSLKLCAAVVDTAVFRPYVKRHSWKVYPLILSIKCTFFKTVFSFCMIENRIYFDSFYACGTEPAPNPLNVVPLRWYSYSCREINFLISNLVISRKRIPLQWRLL
jgi:hypothetical protein